MRDVHRNPVVYYVLIPLMIGVWPLLVWAVYLPAAERDRENDYRLLLDGQTNILEILEIDPQRTSRADPNHVGGEFAYARAVDREANFCGILPSNKNVSAQNIVQVSGKERQDARVELKDVSIVQAARFLSGMQSTWVNLNCDKLELTRKKGMPDQWKVDLHFIYYY
ncbi:MAG: hypothetical protein ABFD90_18180 [Phycisphaerales bacterium]